MNLYPPPSHSPAKWYERLPWYCCNVDFRHMEQSPNADRIMYQGLGWSIIASATIASLSTGYGLFLIVEHSWVALFSIVVGALMILIFRYSMSKRGVGDGTPQITFFEIVKTMPQLVLVVFFGNLLSLPMEYVVLKNEINVEVYTQLAKDKERIRKDIEAQYFDEQQTIRRAITKLESEMATKQRSHEQLIFELSTMKERVENTPKHQRTQTSNDGPSWYDQVELVERLEDQVTLSEAQTNTAMKQLKSKLTEQENKQQALTTTIHTSIESTISNLPEHYTFMDSLPYLKRVGGHIRLFIKGLLCSILLSPFIFMMMLSKNTYWIFNTQSNENTADLKGDFL